MEIYIIKEEIMAYVSFHTSITKRSKDLLTSETIDYNIWHHKPRHFKNILIQYNSWKEL